MLSVCRILSQHLPMLAKIQKEWQIQQEIDVILYQLSHFYYLFDFALIYFY